MKPRCIECNIKPVSEHLQARHGIGLFCSMKCASNFAHLTARGYIACPHCGLQHPSEDFDQKKDGEIQCPNCDQVFPEKAAVSA